MHLAKDLFTPFGRPRLRLSAVALLWFAATIALWQTTAGALTPRPLEVAKALFKLGDPEVIIALVTSFIVNIEALVISACASLAIAYLSTVPALRPPTIVLSALRFLGYTGLTYFFMRWTSNGHSLKVLMLSSGMAVFYLTAMLDVVASVSQAELDHARTVGLTGWRLLYEVVIRGRLHHALEQLRQNAAMGWMMLTMVESLVRSEGGIGVRLLNENRLFNLEMVLAIQLLILGVGLGLDYALGVVRRMACPYAYLVTERR